LGVIIKLLPGLRAILLTLAVLNGRRIHRPTAPFERRRRSFFRWQERFRHRRQRRHLVWVQWAHEPGGHEHHQLGSFRADRTRLEKITDDRQISESWNLGVVVLRYVIEQARNRERLAVPQFHICLGAASGQGRDPESAKADAVWK